ncbi:MAG: putative Acriflavine resistance protein acrA [Myxococcales bacterium]|nr:putative Acriflavine resistance protein acrA [Myxococcales bacterium]
MFHGPRALALLVAAVVVGVVSGCGAKSDAPKKRPPPLVTVTTPEVRDVPILLTYTVDIRPVEQADLQSKVQGYVEKIYVDRGDAVKKGQLLAEIRPSDLPQLLGQARENVGQTEASFRLAGENARRARELFQRGMVSRADLDQAEAQLQIAESARGSARAGMGVVSTRLSETRLVAPFSGWVSERKLDQGSLVQPGPQNSTILTVVRIDQVRVFVSVLEAQAPLVRRGQPATVTVDAVPGKLFQGTVTRVPPSLDTNTRTLTCEIVIPNPDGTLKPGMYGRAALTVDTHPRGVVLPVEAVVAEEAERSVFIVDQIKPAADGKGPATGIAHRVLVQTGFDGGEWLEITKGLTGTESVIVAGVDLAADGMPVGVAKKKSAPPSQAKVD